MLKQHLLVTELITKDYRIQAQQLSRFSLIDAKHSTEQDRTGIIFNALTHQHTPQPTSIIIGKHKITVHGAGENVLWLKFTDLCAPPRSQADYFKICERYTTIIITNLHTIDPRQHDLAISWIRCIDIFYNAKINLFISSLTPLDQLYPSGIYANIHERTLSRLQEMLAKTV
jgi:cell division protein ZapE